MAFGNFFGGNREQESYEPEEIRYPEGMGMGEGFSSGKFEDDAQGFTPHSAFKERGRLGMIPNWSESDPDWDKHGYYDWSGVKRPPRADRLRMDAEGRWGGGWQEDEFSPPDREEIMTESPRGAPGILNRANQRFGGSGGY